MAAGSGGRLLVLSDGQDPARQPTSVAAADGAGAARPVPLEPGAQATLVAAGGGRAAAVVYTLRDGGSAGPPRRRLALVDLPAAAVLRTHPVCRPGEAVTSLAMADGSAGPAVYLALWAGPQPVAGRWSAGGGRRRRLYCVEAFPDETAADGTTELVPRPAAGAAGGPGGSRWQVVGLHSATLDPESRQTVAPPATAPRWLAVAPNGERAFALAPTGGVLSASALIEIDLPTGSARPLAVLPAEGLGLSVSDEAVYVPHPEGNAIWLVDRCRGGRVTTIPVGRRPVGIASAGAE